MVVLFAWGLCLMGCGNEIDLKAETNGQGGARATRSQCLGSDDLSTGRGPSAGQHAFSLHGRTRRYLLELPESYSAERAWPLVLALHPNGAQAEYFQSELPGRDLSSEAGDEAILVYLEAIDGKWRDYNLKADAWPVLLEEELDYVETVLAELRSDLCLAEDKIFALGFSGGGSLAGALSCRRTDIAAFAAAGAVLYFDPTTCVGTSAAWIENGETDLTPEREAFRDWFQLNSHCGEVSLAEADGPCSSYQDCDRKKDVVNCVTPGLGHEVPDYFVGGAWQFFRSFL